MAAGCVGLAACGSVSGHVSGRVTGLVGNLGQGSSAGDNVLAGEPADFTGFLENHTGYAITLETAQLLPLPDFRSPRLAHFAVETGPQFAAADRDWPPAGPGYRLRPFAGARVAAGQRVNILYSVTARAPGNYADAGIRVAVLVDGSPVSVDVLSAAATCVVPSLRVECPMSFRTRLQNAVNGVGQPLRLHPTRSGQGS